MWKRNLSLWVTGPTVLVSLLLLALCALATIFLYQQQTTSSATLEEDVSSTQVAQDLRNTLEDLAALLRVGRGKVDPLHQRIQKQLLQARQLADKEEERQLVDQLESSLKEYFALWPIDGPHPPREKALDLLEKQAIPRCLALQTFNAQQIHKSGTAHRATLRYVLAGLVGIGVVGAVAGLLLGYGVARRLRHSIYHLSVRVQDAANKLGQDLPAVALAQDDDLHQIHERMQGVVREIEQVVQKLQQREREVLRAEQLAALGQLAAGVAHEMRNPLTSIKMLVQTLREDRDTGTATAEDLEVIEQEIRRMERCLQTFLDYARPPKPHCRPLDLVQPIQRTLALIAGRARKQNVDVQFAPPPAPVYVTADGEQIQQILVNLTLNSLDAMPRGGTLTIALHTLDEQVELSVFDTGPGISPRLLTQLFQPFVSTKETGLGLGLVTSRRIAEVHGGSLEAANRPEGGACFALRLPAQPLAA
jgi:two-component system sensor histidine kinase HydH